MRSAVTDVVTSTSRCAPVPAVDGEPLYQEIVPVGSGIAETALSVRKVSSAELDSALSTEVMVGFDVATQLPVRFSWSSRWSRPVWSQTMLAIVLHHIAGDGASLEPLITDLMTAFTLPAGGSGPTLQSCHCRQYADYALWQRDVLRVPDDGHRGWNKGTGVLGR